MGLRWLCCCCHRLRPAVAEKARAAFPDQCGATYLRLHVTSGFDHPKLALILPELYENFRSYGKTALVAPSNTPGWDPICCGYYALMDDDHNCDCHLPCCDPDFGETCSTRRDCVIGTLMTACCLLSVGMYSCANYTFQVTVEDFGSLQFYSRVRKEWIPLITPSGPQPQHMRSSSCHDPHRPVQQNSGTLKDLPETVLSGSSPAQANPSAK